MTPAALTTAHDHPVTLLLRQPVEVGTYTAAAAVLRDHEQANGVTFAALHNETMVDLRDAYRDLFHPAGHDRFEDPVRVRALVRAVENLLGLDETT